MKSKSIKGNITLLDDIDLVNFRHLNLLYNRSRHHIETKKEKQIRNSYTRLLLPGEVFLNNLKRECIL